MNTTLTSQIITQDFSAIKNTEVLESVRYTITNIKITRYEHENEVFDHEKGEYNTNCSGFANFILLGVSKNAYNVLHVEEKWCWTTKPPRPRAAAYYNAFINAKHTENSEQRYWTRIRNIMNTNPGDFLAWRADQFDGNSNSGHVVIIWGLPKLLDNRTVSIEVVDASKSPHSNDTRKMSTEKGGIGRGVMKFTINGNGKPIGFYWTLQRSEIQFRQIAIGRLK